MDEHQQSTPVDFLNRLRDALVERRRDACRFAAEKERPNPHDVVEIQAQIEAIDRAIADETALARTPSVYEERGIRKV